jgi:hypothetical protein
MTFELASVSYAPRLYFCCDVGAELDHLSFEHKGSTTRIAAASFDSPVMTLSGRSVRAGSIEGRGSAMMSRRGVTKTGFGLGSGATGFSGPIGAGGKGLYRAAHTPSRSIEHGRAICDCDDIMQISPVRAMKARFIDASRAVGNRPHARSGTSVAN